MEKNVAQFTIAMVALVILIGGVVGADIYLHEANKDPLLEKGNRLVNDINLNNVMYILHDHASTFHVYDTDRARLQDRAICIERSSGTVWTIQLESIIGVYYTDKHTDWW